MISIGKGDVFCEINEMWERKSPSISMKADEKRKDSPKLHMNYASRRKDAIAVTVEFERARASRSRSALGAARCDARRDAARLAISAG